MIATLGYTSAKRCWNQIFRAAGGRCDRWCDLRDVPRARNVLTLALKLQVICPLLGGPKSMLFWSRKEKTNAIQETHAGGDYRQAA